MMHSRNTQTLRRLVLCPLAVCAAVLTVTACGVTRLEDGDTSTTDSEGGDAEVPLWVQDAFDRSCATDGCHSSAAPALGLSLAAGDSDLIIGGASAGSELPLVELGNVEGSYMALKMLPAELLPEDTPALTQMPPAPTDDSDEDVATILGWIAGTPAAALARPDARMQQDVRQR